MHLILKRLDQLLWVTLSGGNGPVLIGGVGVDTKNFRRVAMGETGSFLELSLKIGEGV